MTDSNNTNAVNFDNNANYFPSNGGLGDQGLYCDTSQLICPGVYTVSAVAFWLKGNRLAVKIGYYDDTNGLTWVENTENNPSYWQISEDDTYATLSPVLVPAGKVLRGLQLAKNGNQLGYQIYVSDPDSTNGVWINSTNADYWPGSVENIYADSNSVILGKGDTANGFQVWQKGNRIAPSLIVS